MLPQQGPRVSAIVEDAESQLLVKQVAAARVKMGISFSTQMIGATLLGLGTMELMLGDWPGAPSYLGSLSSGIYLMLDSFFGLGLCVSLVGLLPTDRLTILASSAFWGAIWLLLSGINVANGIVLCLHAMATQDAPGPDDVSCAAPPAQASPLPAERHATLSLLCAA